MEQSKSLPVSWNLASSAAASCIARGFTVWIGIEVRAAVIVGSDACEIATDQSPAGELAGEHRRVDALDGGFLEMELRRFLTRGRLSRRCRG